jgi:signal recognition particle receptor subunit beta
MYYRDVKACVLVHDATRGTDFQSLDLWALEFVTHHSTTTSASVSEGTNAPVTVLFSVFVNKIDLVTQQELILI